MVNDGSSPSGGLHVYDNNTVILVARLCSEIKYLTKRQMALGML